MLITVEIQKMQTEKEKTDKKQQSYYCDVLNQKFSNYSTYAARLTTKKYQKAVEDKKSKSQISGQDGKNSEEKSQTGEVMEDKILEEPQAQPNFKKKSTLPSTLESLNVCLFSNVMFPSFEDNLANMQKKYGFFILDEKCCMKKPELIKYLAKLIHKDFTCIYCQARFKDAFSTQKHIISKQHALMNSEYFGQYERFYDFREENRKIALELQERFKNVNKGNEYIFSIKAKPEKPEAAAPAVDEIKEDVDNDDEEDEDWEDDSNQEITEQYNIRKVRRLETGELLLPSGKIAGHRKYKIYYKQRIRLRDPENPMRQLMADPTLQKRLLRQEQALVAKISSLPGNAQGHLSLRSYNNFLAGMRKKVDKINNTTYSRLKNDWMKIGISHNRLQKHFRNRNVVFG